jgi:hypothetical protein
LLKIQSTWKKRGQRQLNGESELIRKLNKCFLIGKFMDKNLLHGFGLIQKVLKWLKKLLIFVKLQEPQLDQEPLVIINQGILE